jgi:hypothetical protein
MCTFSLLHLFEDAKGVMDCGIGTHTIILPIGNCSLTYLPNIIQAGVWTKEQTLKETAVQPGFTAELAQMSFAAPISRTTNRPAPCQIGKSINSFARIPNYSTTSRKSFDSKMGMIPLCFFLWGIAILTTVCAFCHDRITNYFVKLYRSVPHTLQIQDEDICLAADLTDP